MIFFYFVILAACFMSQADDKDLFKEANQYYAQGLYDQALHVYERIDDKTPAVYYNMGNSYYQAHNYLYAYLYWLRVQRYGDATLFVMSSNNIKQLAAHGLQDHTSALLHWFWWLSKFFSIYVWQMFLLICWYLLLLLVYKKYSFWYRALLLLLMLFCAIPVIVTYYASIARGMIVVDAAVYNGPNSSFYRINNLTKGILVAVKEKHDDWIKVSFNDQIGWVESKHVQQI